MPTVFLNDPVFRRLGKVARIAALDGKERRDYEQSLKTYRDNYAILTTERREGFAEGERRATINLAHKMIDNGIPLSEVLKITGITEEDLQ